MYKAEGIKVVAFDNLLDTQFAAAVESKLTGVRFVRVDADLAGALKAEGAATENEALVKLFREVSGDDKLTVKLEALKDADIPAILNVSEQSRRMEDMMRMYRMSGGEGEDRSFPTESTLILNTASPLMTKVEGLLSENEGKAKDLATYLYRLTVLSQRRLSAEEMQSFLKESYRILTELAQ